MTKRIAVIILAGLILLGVSSCGFIKNTSANTDQTNDLELNYVTTTCKSSQAREKISVVDGNVYCMWSETKYNDEGRETETYFLDVYNNGS